MSRRDPMVPMHHMLDHAREAVHFAQGRKREDLETDRQFYLAMVQLIQIIGEAARRVPRESRSQWSNVPWAEVTGMRDRLIHGYDVVDLDFLWQTVTENLQPLIVELEKIVPPVEPK